MDVGLLWYDNSGQELAAKVRAAAQGYRRRFGGDPNVCYVHPTMLTGAEEQRVNGIRVRPLQRILKHHFWVGEERTQQ